MRIHSPRICSSPRTRCSSVSLLPMPLPSTTLTAMVWCGSLKTRGHCRIAQAQRPLLSMKEMAANSGRFLVGSICIQGHIKHSSLPSYMPIPRPHISRSPFILPSIPGSDDRGDFLFLKFYSRDHVLLTYSGSRCAREGQR